MRRPGAVVTPDPDQGGARLYGVTRTTYDADGNPHIIDKGEVSTPSAWETGLTAYARSVIDYDTYGRKVSESQINLATAQPETVTQTSYDSAGLVECVAQRMNPSTYGSLPGACTQTTAGSFGPDHIVRTTYDANGDPLKLQSGYGTALVRDERTMTYLAPGQVGTLKDAANNLTTLEYDGFNRLMKTRYPTGGAAGQNLSSTSDYEQLGYDAANNITSERRRDGLMVYNTYDNLNRLRLKDLPGSDPDVTNSFDDLDHLVAASNANGSIAWAYDALGRVTSEAQPNATVQYAYYDNGARKEIYYLGGYVHYDYYDDGTLKLIGLNGTSDILATYYYDQLGRRTSMCRSAGSSTACSGGARTVYSYDAVSRLAGLSHDLATGGSAYDMATSFAYSPASQLISRSAATSTYEWAYGQTFNDGYAVNGLNQYTSVAGQSLSYDGRGNTTNDTSKAYAYDALNRLTGSSTNGASAAYDASGRLLSITQGGATTRFLYDGTRLIAEYDGAGTLLRSYVHGDGVDDPIVWFAQPSGARTHLFKDERGSVIAADNGSSVDIKQYDEYGNAAGAYSGRFQYTGQTWMPELGLYYYKARFYNADLGRFMQTDPIGTKDQINLYAYVGNDPIDRTDSTGLVGGSEHLDAIQMERCGRNPRECAEGQIQAFNIAGIVSLPFDLAAGVVVLGERYLAKRAAQALAREAAATAQAIERAKAAATAFKVAAEKAGTNPTEVGAVVGWGGRGGSNAAADAAVRAGQIDKAAVAAMKEAGLTKEVATAARDMYKAAAETGKKGGVVASARRDLMEKILSNW